MEIDMKYTNTKLNAAAQDLILGQKTDENVYHLVEFLYKETYNLAIAEIRKCENILKLEQWRAAN